MSSNTLLCSVLQGRLTIYVDDTVMTNTATLESLYNMSLSLIKSGMNNGELALANSAIVWLRYRDNPDKELVPIDVPGSAINDSNDVVQWSLVTLALLILLLAFLLVARRFKRKKTERKTTLVLDHENVGMEEVYDFGNLDEFIRSHHTEEHSRLPGEVETIVTKSKKVKIPPAFYIPDSYHTKAVHNRDMTCFEIEGIDDFIEDRFTHETTPSCSHSKEIHRDKNNYILSPLNHICVSCPDVYPEIDKNEQDFTHEGMGTNRGITPRCSICFKNADGWMKRCQCSNSSCDKIAHATCIYGKNPTPSLSYPGTPPPMLPSILCGSDSRWIRRSRSYDEEGNTGHLSKSMSFDESVSAQKKLQNGIVRCLDYR